MSSYGMLLPLFFACVTRSLVLEFPADPFTVGWIEHPAVPGPVQDHAAVSLGDEVWVIGGIDDQQTTLDAVWIFDGTWRAGPSLPTPLHHPAVAVHEERIYVLGGLLGRASTPSARAWVLDEAHTGWVPLPDLPSPRGAAAAAAYDDGIALLGGRLQEPSDTAVFFAPATGTWTPLPSLPEARVGAVAATILGSLHVLGGQDDEQDNAHADHWTLGWQQWEPASRLSVPRTGLAAAPFDIELVVAGGASRQGTTEVLHDEVDLLDASGTWIALPQLPLAVHSAAAAPYRNGVLVIGGSDRFDDHATDAVQFLVLGPTFDTGFDTGGAF